MNSFLPTAMVSLVTLILLAYGVGHQIFHATPEDFNLYKSLMAEANPNLVNQTEKAAYTATQKQQSVRKDIYFSKGLDRLHFLLACSDVNAIFDHQSGKTELMEELTDVRFLAQQELFYADSANGRHLQKEDPLAFPWQKIYRGSAHKVFFSYKKWTFTADKLQIVEYEIPGHEIFVETEEKPFSELLMSLEALKASYNGESVHFEDEVRFDHPLGLLLSDEAVLSPNVGSKSLFETILLKKNVTFAFKNQGILTCQRALFNTKTLKGHFSGNKKSDLFVTYMNYNINRGSPISFKSHTMDLSLTRASPEHDAADCLEKLIAKGEVDIDYCGECYLTADRAVYHRDTVGQNALSLHQLPGKITLDAPEKEDKLCHLISQNGDHLTGSKVEIDTNQRKVHVIDSKGVFNYEGASASDSPSSPPPQSTLDITASHLLWDLSRDMLSLKEDVELKHDPIGTFQSDQELKIYYTKNKGQNQLRAIESEGNIILRYEDALKKQSHWILCHGKMIVDHEQMVVTFQSFTDSMGKVNQEKQVFFYDQLGEIQADKMTIFYEQVEGKPIARKVKLEGNVFMLDHKKAEDVNNNERPFIHYAISDVVEYTLGDRETHLYASEEGHRVLFYDKINHLQISAPALKIIRDQETKKESIKGIGDVRFHFLDSELEQLRKYSLTK